MLSTRQRIESRHRSRHALDCTATLREAARLMPERDIGSVPVSRDQRLVGMVTDRDIVVRGIACGLADDAPLSEIVSGGIKYCFDDQPVDDVASNMAQPGVRRLPVVDREKRLVGFVSLSDIHGSDDDGATEELLDGTARPHWSALRAGDRDEQAPRLLGQEPEHGARSRGGSARLRCRAR